MTQKQLKNLLRILVELDCIGLTDSMYDEVRDAMNLTDDELDDLFTLAVEEWKKLK